MKVSFFEPLPAHLQTASHRPPVNPNNPGAWGNAEIFLANGTWSGKSFFGTGYHDPDNRGFPGATAANLTNYRTNAQYFTRAKQEWLGGAIAFDFPVKWNSPTRSFRSLTPIKEDFVVVNTERRVAYLSAERAEVRFGAQVGLPQLNLANFVVNEITEATGMATVVSNAIGGAVVGGLSTGLDRLGDVLKDHLREHYERVLGSSLDAMANQIHAHLLTQWTGTGWVGGNPPSLASFFSGPAPQIEAAVWSKLGSGPGSQIAELTSALNQAIDAIDLFIGPNGLLRSDGSSGVDVAIARTLASALVRELAGNVNTNRLTLTAYRASEPAKPIPATGPVTGRVLATPEQLAELEQYRSGLDPGHKLGDVVRTLRETLRDSNDPKMVALRAVTLEVHRISARWGGQFPGAFPAPLDALREFFATGVLPVAYRNDWTNGLPPAFGGALTALTTNDYASAYAGVAMLVSLPAPRAVVVRDLLVRPDSIGLNCTVLNRVGVGTPVALVTAEGRPFRFPSSFSLVPGVAVRVTAFADAPSTGCAAETLEVIRLGDELLAQVTGVPLPSPTDTDGNLLDDDWERLFLGGLGNDPFAGLGGGHTLLQSYLDGTDPMLPGSYGQWPPASLAPPTVEIRRLNPTTVQLRWQFAPAYAPRLDFKLQGTTALGAVWENLPASVEDLGGGQYRMLASSPTGNTAFWRLTLRLR